MIHKIKIGGLQVCTIPKAVGLKLKNTWKQCQSKYISEQIKQRSVTHEITVATAVKVFLAN